MDSFSTVGSARLCPEAKIEDTMQYMVLRQIIYNSQEAASDSRNVEIYLRNRFPFYFAWKTQYDM